MDVMHPSRMRGRHALLAGALLALLALLASRTAMATDGGDEALADLSLEELLSVEITTLSRKAEDLGRAPAAVFVISRADIRRSGARTLPDLLRMVPGMQIAQIDGNKWAVTARGANGRFANKLLVLMDGRSLYNPLLSGVYWDIQDTDLDAVERIEVIRGPGATMWGANAVNGVVNIITRHAADSTGGSVSALASDRDSVEGVVRYGAADGDLAWRSYLKVSDRRGNVDETGADAHDDSRMTRVGLRADVGSDTNQWSFSAEAYDGDSGSTRVVVSPAPPYQSVSATEEALRGGFALINWSNTQADGSHWQVRGFAGIDEREMIPLTEKRATLDIDVQHAFEAGMRHRLMWGVAYRHSRDRTEGSFQIVLDPAERTQRLLSGFIQDDIELFDGRGRLMIGSKFEHGNFAERTLQIEPSVRFSYDVGDGGTLWGALSRAVRLPSRGEQDGVIAGAVLAPGATEPALPVPLAAVASGRPDMASETVIAWEAGYRWQRDDLLIDVAAFLNAYDNLRSVALTPTTCQPSGAVIALDPACLLDADYAQSAALIGNDAESDSRGIEVALSRQLAERWRLHAAYTWYDFDSASVTEDIEFAVAEDSPSHQLSVRSSLDLPRGVEFDLWLRYVDELEIQGVEDYTAVDLRLTWAPSDRLAFAAAGRNLLAGRHLEFVSELGDIVPVRIEPEGYVEMTWSF